MKFEKIKISKQNEKCNVTYLKFEGSSIDIYLNLDKWKNAYKAYAIMTNQEGICE